MREKIIKKNSIKKRIVKNTHTKEQTNKWMIQRR